MSFAAKNISVGQLNALFKKVGEKDGMKRLLSGESIVKPAQEVDFPIWKTIFIGEKINYRKRLFSKVEEDIFSIDHCLLDRLGRKKVIQVKLVKILLSDLGFTEPVSRYKIYKRAKEVGLSLCPEEVGPELRAQYTDQPKGEHLIIASTAFDIALFDSRLYCVSHDNDGKMMLKTSCCVDFGDHSSTNHYNPEHCFIFMERIEIGLLFGQ